MRKFAPIELETDAPPAEGAVDRAQRLAAQGDCEGAAGLLWSVVSVPGATEGARALVILARLQLERLNQPQLGWTLYRRVVAEHPGTPAAAYAQARLDEAGEAG
jgi:TolA-binding protein